MSITAHAAAGIILTKYLVSRSLIPTDISSQLYLFSAVTSCLPDIDTILFKKIYEHRDHSPFHYPFTWWLIFVTAIIFAIAQHQRFLLPYIYLAITNVLLHFILDTFGVNAGICWFKPFYKKEYSFLPLTKQKPTNVKTWIGNYVGHPMLYADIVLTLLGLIVLFTD